MRSARRGASLRANDLSFPNDLLHNLNSPRLQWTHGSTPREPHAFLLCGTVNDFKSIICRGVVKCAATVLLEKLEKQRPPWVIQERKEFLSKGFQVFDADHLDVLLDRFAPVLRDSFNVEVFWFHMLY